jgi:S1-C subfamily serine protease
VRDSPADLAGLQGAANATLVNGQSIPAAIDIITAIDGTSIKGMDDLISYLARETSPGQVVTLDVLRDGEDGFEVDITLAPRP